MNQVRQLVVALILFVGVFVGISSNVSAHAQSADEIVTGEFVGLVDTGERATPDAESTEPLIAVTLVADGIVDGAPDRRVRAYVCDGVAIAEWFVGQADGNHIAMTSVAGASSTEPEKDGAATPTAGGSVRIEADLTADAATGTITLADGRELTFTAPRSDGLSGMYTLEITVESAIAGTSASGTTLAGTVTDTTLDATLTLSDGETMPLVEPRSGSPMQGTWIVIVVERDESDGENGLTALGARQAVAGDSKKGSDWFWAPGD